MKIINKQPKQKRFFELENGVVFQNGSKFFMKTERIEIDEFSCNAVDLKTGELVQMFVDATVTPLNCNLVIE